MANSLLCTVARAHIQAASSLSLVVFDFADNAHVSRIRIASSAIAVPVIISSWLHEQYTIHVDAVDLLQIFEYLVLRPHGRHKGNIKGKCINKW